MKMAERAAVAIVLILLFPMPVIGPAWGDDENTPGVAPCDLLLSSDGSRLFILEEGTRRLRITDAEGKTAPVFLCLPFKPTRMVFFPGEEQLAVIGGGPAGSLAVVSLPQLPEQEPAISSVYTVGHTPSGLAVGKHDGRTRIYVAHQFDDNVWEIDAETGEHLRTFDVGREPVSLAITPDYQNLVTTSMVAARRADVSNTMALAHVVDLADGNVHEIAMRNGVTNLREVTISPDGEYALMTGTVGNYLTVPVQVVGGWIVENIVSVIDVKRHELVDILFLDDVSRGAANPWGLSVSPDGEFLAVALSGTNEILLLPYDRIETILKEHPSGVRPGFGTYITYSSQSEDRLPMRMRTTLDASGIRHVVARGDSVWALSYFHDKVERIKVEADPPFKRVKDDYHYPNTPLLLQPEKDTPCTGEEPLRWLELEPNQLLSGLTIRRWSARLGPEPVMTPQRRGEEVFHDALICMEHWQSCITCHPEGRVDGLNWDLVNDGVGNPKNTKSLLLSHETPPSMITGVRADAETAVRAGVTHILFSKIPEEDYEAMDAFLSAMKPVPSPHLIDGRLSPSAQRGKFLFDAPRVGCSTCHPEPLFTDMSFHRSEARQYNEGMSKFDTPTLIEVWRTAPYMNNGHWLTIREVLLDAKHGNPDGRIDHLTEQELDDLIEYVLSL